MQVGDAYLAGLNLGRRFIVPPPPPPPPVPAQAVPPGSVASSDAASGGGTLSKAAEAGVITAACVGAALIAVAVAMVLLRLRSQRRRGAYVPNEMPGPGPSTTLVVTDIEDSTVLWCVGIKCDALLSHSCRDAGIGCAQKAVPTAAFAAGRRCPLRR